MPSPRMAVEAGTDLLARARQIQRSWDRLLGEGALGPELPPQATAGMRPMIVDSWRRVLATGLEPIDVLPSIEADPAETRERWLEHPLGLLRHVLVEPLQRLAVESNSVVQVTDPSGLTLYLGGPEWLKARAAEMNLVEGARCSETVNGTNGVGTALATDQPVQVFAFEHFSQHHREWVCSGAPIHDRVSGRLLGVIDLSSPWRIAHPRSLELVTNAARTTEQCLLEGRRDQDARLRRRYGDLATKSTDLLVNREGYLLIGDDSARLEPLEIPESGGEIAMGDGSLAVAEPLGRGEAYLVRRPGPRRARQRATRQAESHLRELAEEQAALRQVATLVAYESSPDRLVAVVAEQVARVFDVPLVRLLRYEPTAAVVVGGFSENDDEPFAIGSRWPLDTPGLLATIRETGRAARVEDYAQRPGDSAGAVRAAGMRCAVGSPIVVGGRVWGAIVLLSPRRGSLPEDTGARLADFTDLVATALANAESRAALSELADEQAALRRVATLVARAPASEQLFSTVAREVASVLDVPGVIVTRYEPDGTAVTVGEAFGPDLAGAEQFLGIGTPMPPDPGTLTALVLDTHAPARVDDLSTSPGTVGEVARAARLGSGCAGPIVVNGAVWGKMCVFSRVGAVLAAGTESRLRDFIELVATAIANYEARAELAASEAGARQLADEQAALQRVATLVAKGANSEAVFSAVAQEVAHVFGVQHVTVCRFEPDTVLVLSSFEAPEPHAAPPPFPAGRRLPLDRPSLPASVYRAGEPVRIDDFTASHGLYAVARQAGLTAAVGVPIVVDGTVWGAVNIGSTKSERLLADAEERLARFTELVATSVSNATMREELAASEARASELAEEQAALRRVATLVARGVGAEEIFSAVTNEVAQLFGSSRALVGRFEPDGSAMVVVGVSNDIRRVSIGSRWQLEDYMASTAVFRTGHPVRVERSDFEHVSGPMADVQREIGAPIVVHGAIWGVIAASWRGDDQPPADAEDRLNQFAELLATEVSNAIMREEVMASRARVIAATDDARRRIERDVHDGAQQRLVTLTVALRRVEAKIPARLDDLRGDVKRVTEGLTTAAEELRELSRGIHPSILTEGGLLPALKALGRRSPVRVKLDVALEQRLPDHVEVAAYYTVSEALTNAAKHAEAAHVWVSLRVEGDLLVLSIVDDGIGGANSSGGSGLTGLRDRIEALGGEFRIESPPDRGTRIDVQIPTFLPFDRHAGASERRSPAPS